MHRAILFLFALLPLSAQIIVNTFAGGAIPSGIPAQNAYLADVSGITWDHSGNLVFCDSVNNVIRRVNASGTIETIAGNSVAAFAGDGGPALSASLLGPRSPRYDSAGNLYFIDRMNARIRRVDTNGVITTVAGDGIDYFAGMDLSGPATSVSLDNVWDLAVDAAGTVYFTELSGNRIRRVKDGQVDLYAGTGALGCPACPNFNNGDGGLATAAVLDNPSFIAAGANGEVYFVDAYYTEIRKISSDGIISTFVPPIFSPGVPIAATINAVTADPLGNIYAGINGIIRYNSNGSGTTVNKTVPVQTFTVDAQGNLGFSERIRGPSNYLLEVGELSVQGAVTMLAGMNPQPAPDGTPLKQSWFFNPSSIAFDQAGNLYIADQAACQIREITTAGTLGTFAGTGACGFGTPSGNAKSSNLPSPISIAVDSHNNVWVASAGSNVYAIAQDGTISVLPKASPVGQTISMAFDSKGRLYVGAFSVLVRVNTDQSLQAIIGPGGLNVDGLSTDPSGNVYFGSTFDAYRINDDGSYSKVAQSSTGFSAYAGNPAFAVDAAGNIWQGPTVVNPAGTVLFGISQGGLSGDGGPAVSAGFNSSAAAFSPSGRLYIIDTNRIRVFSGSGPVQGPAIAQGGIVNAASYTGGAIAPGELISIFGSNFGATSLASSTAVNGALPTALGRTRVLFNGAPGAITAVSPNQINAFVPSTYDQVTAGSPVQVQVQVDDVLSAAVSVPVADSAPALFAADASGTGQGAILNQDGSINSSANPATAGQIISLFGTGEGAISPALPAGSLALSTPLPAISNRVSVAIGGVAAQTTYTGEAPTLPAGIFQLNATIPPGTAAGNIPVSVSIGSNSSASHITVAVH